MTQERNDYVVVFALGPVQGFIAAARRSRDLWAGSWLLSELAKAAARAWAVAGRSGQPSVQLVFPAVAGDGAKELSAGSDLNVANKVRAVVYAATEEEVRALIELARQAVHEHWRERAQEARGKLGPAADTALRRDRWDAQLDDVWETYGAWARIEGGAGGEGYAAAAALAERLLAARKATRDFAPAALDPLDAACRLPKSSLDGARETVLAENASAGRNAARRVRQLLGLSAAEQLDAAGLIKRVLGTEERFTPLTRVAADPWLQRLSDEERQALRERYEPLVKAGWATRVGGNKGIYGAFPYDAGLCFRSRLQQALREVQDEVAASAVAGEDSAAAPSKPDPRGKSSAPDAAADGSSSPPEPQAVLAHLNALHATLKPLWGKYGEALPYAVMLQADGDRMGELLDRVQTLSGHQEVTRCLSAFAKQVPDIVRKHRGHALYSGGDDVLAILPTKNALTCAEALHGAFGRQMEAAMAAVGLAADAARGLHAPTLSVGVAIVHILEPMGEWRRHALEAEKLAKGDHEPAHRRRNGLAIRLAVRAGHIVQVRYRWDDGASAAMADATPRCDTADETPALAALRQWADAYSGEDGQRRRAVQLPSRLAYDVRAIAQRARQLLRTRPGEAPVAAALWRAAVEGEWALLLQRCRCPSGQPLSSEMRQALVRRWEQLLGNSTADPHTAATHIETLANELLLGRWLAARNAADLDRGAA